MRSYVAVSLKLAAGMSVVIALLTCILCEDILRIMRTPENIFEGAYAYLLVTFIGVPCTFFLQSSFEHYPCVWETVRRLSGFCCLLLF